MTRRRMQENVPALVGDEGFARNKRRTFHDSDPRGKYVIAQGWPSEMRHIGTVLSVSYASDKWGEDTEQDYKHVAEGPQSLFIAGKVDGVRPYGPMVSLPKKMPRDVAELAKLYNVQAHLFGGLDGRGRGVHTSEDSVYTLDWPGSILYAARFPDTGEPFLCVCSRGEICAIITGDELDVLKDGIVG